jgi:hypothetical protein
MFMNLGPQKPMVIEVTKDILFMPHRIMEDGTLDHRHVRRRHPLQGQMKLLVNKLSGRYFREKATSRR